MNEQGTDNQEKSELTALTSEHKEKAAEDTTAKNNDIFTLTAGDIMDRQTIWASPEDSIEAVIELMDLHNTGYVIIGNEGVCQGIISRSNIAEAISPFLKPEFAQWHRPLDDSSLHIKIKWFMTAPVQTVGLFETLDEIVTKMCSLGIRSLAVVNADEKVVGIINVFNVFKILLKKSENTRVIDESSESQTLVRQST